MILDTQNLPISMIMQKEVVTIYDNQSIFDASVLMETRKVGTLPVIKHDGTLVGVLTDRDIVVKCNYFRRDVCSTKVSECMTVNPCKTVPSMTCENAMYLMSSFGVRRLPIVKNDKLVGIVSISDIAKVSNFCPNQKCAKNDCILIEIANQLRTTSHLPETTWACEVAC